MRKYSKIKNGNPYFSLLRRNLSKIRILLFLASLLAVRGYWFREYNKEFYDSASLHPHFASQNIAKFQKLVAIIFKGKKVEGGQFLNSNPT